MVVEPSHTSFPSWLSKRPLCEGGGMGEGGVSGLVCVCLRVCVHIHVYVCAFVHNRHGRDTHVRGTLRFFF